MTVLKERGSEKLLDTLRELKSWEMAAASGEGEILWLNEVRRSQ